MVAAYQGLKMISSCTDKMSPRRSASEGVRSGRCRVPDNVERSSPSPTTRSPTGSPARCRALSTESYFNPRNPEAHYERQSRGLGANRGKVNVFVAGMGTGGTSPESQSLPQGAASVGARVVRTPRAPFTPAP